MTRSGIEQMLYLMDAAYDNSQHALLRNLRAVTDEDWLWTPQGGQRSIFHLVQHVGNCKYIYDNNAFGDRSMRWDSPDSFPTIGPATSREDAMVWLQQGHQRLRDHLSGLEDDSELIHLRWSNWDKQYEARWLISTMIEHDLYHSGEINHIRALAQKNDDGNE
jgi:hypothetical protein